MLKTATITDRILSSIAIMSLYATIANEISNLSFFILVFSTNGTLWNFITYLFLSSLHYLHIYYQKFKIYLYHISQFATVDSRNSQLMNTLF